MARNRIPYGVVVLVALLVPGKGYADAKDPGPRGGTAAAGDPLPGLTAAELEFFRASAEAFEEVPAVVSDDDHGLGPRYNGISCVSCHSQPAPGGTSPAVNPQFEAASAGGAMNTIPFFLHRNGPAREVRFKFVMRPDGSRGGTRDGGVHAIFTITGRADAGSCSLAQPDFVAAARARNLSFRIPTPTFGEGLIEAVADFTILQSHAATVSARRALGIGGRANVNGNDGTITRFGWKAQNKSLAIFAGEAYNVEMGVTNELFPTEREESAACRLNATPEDQTGFDAAGAGAVSSDTVKFATFMRLLAPPRATAPTASTERGRQLFGTVGCVLCHTPSLAVGPSTVEAITRSGRAELYSDLILHRMGPRLADDIQQGVAGGDEFRTAPLWGLGQRLFFLHDGRTSDLRRAVELHASGGSYEYPASEANGVVQRFTRLTEAQKQDLLNFLRSL